MTDDLPTAPEHAVCRARVRFLAHRGRAGPAPIRFNTNFEGGSLGRIEQVGEDAFRCHVKGQQDEHGRNRQASWYYFRIDGAEGREVTITLTDFVGEYNGRPAQLRMGPDILPVFSDDGEHWTPIADVRWDDRAKEATIRLRPGKDSIWIAHQPPYTPRRLARLLEQVDRCDDARIEVIGKSAMGRDLHMVTVTAADVDDREKAVGLAPGPPARLGVGNLVCHGGRRCGSSPRTIRRPAPCGAGPSFCSPRWSTPMAAPPARSGSMPTGSTSTATGTRSTCDRSDTWPTCRRSGTSSGRSGRAFDSGRPIHLMINLHNTETGEYLSTMADDPVSRAIAGRSSDRLVRETTFRPHRGPVLGERRDGSANVLHQEKGILIFLMEQRIARDPKTGQPPSVEGRLRFGEQLIAIMAETARP